MSTTRLLPVLLAALLCAVPARAQRVEFVGGAEGTSAIRYAFAMPSVTVGLRPGVAVAVRGSLSDLRYSFTDAAGPADVRSPGAMVGVALRLDRPRLSISAGPAFEVRRTRRTSASGADSVETERGLLLQGDVFARPARGTTLSALASYGFANAYTWSRAGVLRQVSNRDGRGPLAVSVGAEATAQGNRVTRALGLGGVVELGLVRLRTSVQVRSGYTRTDDGGAVRGRPYVGAGVYRAF